jgi:hypothetical protein
MEGLPTLYLYGDPSYKHSYGVMAPFKRPRGRFALESWKQKANERMSSEDCCEHAVGHTQVLWTYTAFEKGLRAGSSLVTAYFAAAVLTNSLTCLRGNQTSARFVVNPPSLEAYLLSNQPSIYTFSFSLSLFCCCSISKRMLSTNLSFDQTQLALLLQILETL